MRKSLYFLLFVLGCGGSEPEPEPAPPVVLTYQVRCPLTTIETMTDTVSATSFYYSDGALKFYKSEEPRRGLFAQPSKKVGQYPGTCVVKEITQ